MENCGVTDDWHDMSNGSGGTSGSPQDGYMDGRKFLYRYKVSNWPTTTSPEGHNGDHSIKIVEVNCDPSVASLKEEQYVNGAWTTVMKPPNNTDPVRITSSGKWAEVRNLVIKNVQTNTNLDYFKYDPAETAPAAQQNPVFSFDIADGADYGEYVWVIYMRPTPSSDWSMQGDAYIRDWKETPSHVSDSWNGRKNDNTSPDDAKEPRNTYTFDIYVWEVEDATYFINNLGAPYLDWYGFKTPYALKVESHDLQFKTLGDDKLHAVASYKLNDVGEKDAFSMHIDFLDPDFNLKGGATGGTANHTPYENIDLYTFSDDEPEPVTDDPNWRGIFMATDQHPEGNRTHENKRMLAVNGHIQLIPILVDFNTHGAVPWDWDFANREVWHRQKRIPGMTYTNPQGVTLVTRYGPGHGDGVTRPDLSAAFIRDRLGGAKVKAMVVVLGHGRPNNPTYTGKVLFTGKGKALWYDWHAEHPPIDFVNDYEVNYLDSLDWNYSRHCRFFFGIGCGLLYEGDATTLSGQSYLVDPPLVKGVDSVVMVGYGNVGVAKARKFVSEFWKEIESGSLIQMAADEAAKAAKGVAGLGGECYWAGGGNLSDNLSPARWGVP